MSQPAHKIRIGVLQVTIWRNQSEKGIWYSVIPARSYKQGDATWKETDSLGFDDLLTMAKLFDHGPHLDHAPAAGRRQGPQGIRAGGSLNRMPARRSRRPPAALATINSFLERNPMKLKIIHTAHHRNGAKAHHSTWCSSTIAARSAAAR